MMLPPRLVFALRSLALSAAMAAGLLLAGGLVSAQDNERPAHAQIEQGVQARPSLDAAAISERQPMLLGQALEGLKGARTDPSPRLFFVAFAGYGPEAVFKREALAVRDLFDARFGTKGRSLVLVNHASTVNDIALASPANLDEALGRIGSLMKADADILFLFLTSHGRKDLLAVELPGFPFNGLTPAELRAMLDRAHIKKRVIVISACHSGSFIPSLAGPNSLVIAAAHADRASFGCEDRREWTYFGDAFFNRALRREHSIERAFTRAKRQIGRWEARAALTRSLPQIAGGEALRQHLDALTRAAAQQE
ncbi:MAG: peptidase C13, legumain asparaginyl peptidase [Hyphomicrobiaceae bacterium]|nr:peptidase C13, legumain asparaginyl peptidase [Hyphomicrobiaceae bacterium]